MEFALPVRNAPEKPPSLSQADNRNVGRDRDRVSFNDTLRERQNREASNSQQAGNDTRPDETGSNRETKYRTQDETRFSQDTGSQSSEADAEMTADQVLKTELELFVGELLKQIKLPEQSDYALSALSETLSDFIHSAMTSGGIDAPLSAEEMANIDLPLPELEAEIAGVAAPAMQFSANGEGEEGAQVPKAPATPAVATSAGEVPVAETEAEAEDTTQPKAPTFADTQAAANQQRTATAAAGASAERQQLDVAPIDAPRETREGDRQQMSSQRSEAVAPDLSRMQRVNNVANLNQNHNGILISDAGNKNYEIRFASAELGQIKVELQMDGSKPEASVIFNNSDAEKPLRDLFGPLQSRMASLGIENLSLRQDTESNFGGKNASDSQGIDGNNSEEAAGVSEITYYIAPDLTAPGRLDIRF